MADFSVIAHRGASGNWPENTLLAFREALAAGARWLELDVHLSADRQLMVIHDAFLQRTTSGRGKVEQHQSEELQQLDAGQGEPIPLLADVLDLASGRAGVNIELKGPGTGQAVAALLQHRRSGGQISDRILVSSFNVDELRQLSGLLPQAAVGLLTEKVDQQLWRLVEELQPWSLHVASACVDGQLVAEAHRRGLKLLVYTVNDPARLQRLKNIGVDGVFTDFPERFIKV